MTDSRPSVDPVGDGRADAPAQHSERGVTHLSGRQASTGAPPPVSAADRPPEARVGTSESARQAVAITVNGTPYRLELDPRQSLLDLLRETLGLTGTKKGCNQGACGSCTVLVGGRRINACLTVAVMYDGTDVTTIEGLSSGERLHPLQQAFIAHEGFQCGYCTSGQIMSGVACLAEGHTRSVDEIRSWMSGNLCRCGAYPGIVDAIAAVAQRSD